MLESFGKLTFDDKYENKNRNIENNERQKSSNMKECNTGKGQHEKKAT